MIKEYLAKKLQYHPVRAVQDYNLVRKILNSDDKEAGQLLEDVLSAYFPAAIPYAKKAFLNSPKDGETKKDKAKRVISSLGGLAKLAGVIAIQGGKIAIAKNREIKAAREAKKAPKEEVECDKSYSSLSDITEELSDDELSQSYDEYSEWAADKDVWGEY